MASVWKAEDCLLGREVALKILSDELAGSAQARKRFLREARSNATLDHPGVPAIFDFGESDGCVYLAMALIDGQTLSERATSCPMAISEACRVVADAARTLAHAHSAGIIHRDVTGRNIMIARDGRVFVLDFGLALAAGESRITSTNTVIGTPAYLAPEVTLGETADARSDIYGLGVILFEALTGALPFESESRHGLRRAVHVDPPSPRSRRPDIPAELDRIVLKTMARDPDQRFQSAEALAKALSSLRPSALDQTGVDKKRPSSSSAHPPSSASSTLPPPWSARSPTLLAVLPFEGLDIDRDDDGASQRLAHGLAESLSASLVRLPGVNVISPSSTRSLDSKADPQQIARQLGSNLLLRGNVRRSGFDIRVSWTLIDPWRCVEVAGNTVQGKYISLFELEDALEASVRQALGHELAPSRPPRGAPRDPAAQEHYLQALGYLYRTDNNACVDGAIVLLERLLTSEGDSASLEAALGRAYLAKYRLTWNRMWEGRAAAACQRALELDPSAPDVLVTLGDVHRGSGHHEDAIRDYQRALDLRPDLIEAVLGQALAYEGLKEADRAEAACRRAIELRPDDWRVYNRLGTLLLKEGRYDEAAGLFRRVIQLTPDNTWGHSNLGATLFRLDRLEDALACFRRSIEIQPTGRAYVNVGTILFLLRRFPESAEAYERATALAPSDPILWGSLGSAFRWIPGCEARAGEALDRAIAQMRERLERNPRDGESWAWLSAWLANRHHTTEAIEAIERALSLSPDDVSCIAMAGRVYHFLGDRPRALRLFREAVHRGYGIESLRRDPEQAPLMEDPEFRRILEEGSTRSGAELQ